VYDILAFFMETPHLNISMALSLIKEMHCLKFARHENIFFNDRAVVHKHRANTIHRFCGTSDDLPLFSDREDPELYGDHVISAGTARAIVHESFNSNSTLRQRWHQAHICRHFSFDHSFKLNKKIMMSGGFKQYETTALATTEENIVIFLDCTETKELSSSVERLKLCASRWIGCAPEDELITVTTDSMSRDLPIWKEVFPQLASKEIGGSVYSLVPSTTDFAKCSTFTVVETVDTCDQIVLELEQQAILGMDMEWPCTHSGTSFVSGEIALIQIATTTMVYLFQLVKLLNGTGANRYLPDSLVELLGNEAIEKVGVNITNDARLLYTQFGVYARGLVEAGALADAVLQRNGDMKRKKPWSLARLSHRVLGKELQKFSFLQISPYWADQDLDQDHKIYAATDAAVSLEIGRTLRGMLRQQDEGGANPRETGQLCSRSLGRTEV
jgi:hypothetical protein